MRLAYKYGDANYVANLLCDHEDGVDVNEADKWGKTALHYACANDQVAIVRLLLAHKKTDINRGDHQGVTALHLACIEEHLDVVQALLAHKDIEGKKIGQTVGV